MNLEEFFISIPKHEELSNTDLIKYFVYYFQENKEYVMPNDVKNAFLELDLIPYSNINQYLSKHSTGKDTIFIKKEKKGYKLVRAKKELIKKELGYEETIQVSTDLFDINVIKSIPNTPFYLWKIAEQMCACYDNRLYTACFAMIRKLIETLIIECYEKNKIQDNIIGDDGNYFSLSTLIDKYTACNKMNASKNLKESFKNIKYYGDLSVHNRKFFAGKDDIDKLKNSLRQSVQEIILNIDYPNWNYEDKDKNKK